MYVAYLLTYLIRFTLFTLQERQREAVKKELRGLEHKQRLVTIS